MGRWGTDTDAVSGPLDLPPLDLPLLDRAGTAYTKLVLFSYSINKPASPLAPAIKIVEHRGITA